MTRLPRVRALAALLLGVVLSSADDARGYIHIVQPGESLAEVAETAYGDSKKETLIVGANALDAHGGSPIVPGLRLEIPAPTYVRAPAGATWPELAKKYLGDPTRSDVLAKANGAVPWVAPEEGREILVFPVVAHIAGTGESVTTVARKYMLDPEKSWQLGVYNRRKRPELDPGEVILVPLTDLTLDPKGKREAEAYHNFALGEARGKDFDAQKNAKSQLDALATALDDGNYPAVVALGNAIAGAGDLSRPQQARIARALLEAYVALGSQDLAVETCRRFGDVATDEEPELSFDPGWVSPKILSTCRK